MVLSAGFGTRLAPLTDEIPKPLVPIGGIPLLGLILRSLRVQGAERLVVNTHHRSEQIEQYVTGLEFAVHVSREATILGTAGGIGHARSHFPTGVLVVNGDILGDLPVNPLLEARGDGLLLAAVERPFGEGTVGIGSGGRVVRLRGEVFGEEIRSGDYMGAAWLGPQCLSTLPQEGCLVGDFALPHLRAGGRVSTVMVEGTFCDVGTPEAYLQANLSVLAETEPSSVRVPPGVTVRNSSIGQRVTILGRGTIEDTVILAGATARAPLFRCIVTPSGQVMQVSGP